MGFLDELFSTYDSLTLWIDPIAAPQSRGYRYKISEVDSCGDESPLSPYDLTLHLSVDDVLPVGSYKLIWDTSYNGLIFTSYYIYRDTIVNSFTLIDSVQKGTQTYTDFYSTTKNIYYRVGIDNPNGCNPTRSHIKAYSSSHSNYVAVLNSVITATAQLKKASTAEVFPNPSNGKFTIETPVVSNELSVEIYNVLGEGIYMSNLNDSISQIDISGNASGIYLYRVITQTGDLISEGKLIIQK
ncbi:MAG TPA: T9SS type A sorting domain-containing protein [Bacteroidia bacterium]|nr:T9SS type A sorting domain-containing protein [Bacteroidia bacterium]